MIKCSEKSIRLLILKQISSGHHLPFFLNKLTTVQYHLNIKCLIQIFGIILKIKVIEKWKEDFNYIIRIIVH